MGARVVVCEGVAQARNRRERAFVELVHDLTLQSPPPRRVADTRRGSSEVVEAEKDIYRKQV
jgi:hypothetical protein